MGDKWKLAGIDVKTIDGINQIVRRECSEVMIDMDISQSKRLLFEVKWRHGLRPKAMFPASNIRWLKISIRSIWAELSFFIN